MGLVGEVFGAIEDKTSRPAELLLLACAAGFFIFGTMWWRLRGRLRRMESEVNALAAASAAEALSVRDDSSEIAPILSSLTRDLDRAQRELAAVTAAMQAERDAALQADHSKTRFLAAASHDLRQPLQALGLFVAALAQHALPADLRDIVGKIEGSLEALEQLLDALLDISRLDAGAIEAHSIAFPLQSLFDRMAFEFAPQAERKGLSLRLVRTKAVVKSDPALLERILRNLLSNAIRYTKQGGVVLGCRHRGQALRIEIWDSGNGIASADQREIFREFRRLAGQSQDEPQGLGLGLAIVERLTSLLGLTIDLLSVVGRGSMFAIVLPITAQKTDRVRLKGGSERKRL